jgi:hypothetical protein
LPCCGLGVTIRTAIDGAIDRLTVTLSLVPLTNRAAVPSRLNVQLNRLQLANPILVASGTFGYAREMAAFADFTKLGGVIPKTITPQPRAGNPTPRTVETASGMLNSIGLDNDGLDAFIAKHLDYLLSEPGRICGHGRTARSVR